MTSGVLPATFNLAEQLVRRNATAARMGTPVYLHGDDVWTYGDVFDLTTRAAGFLRGSGIGRGERIALLLEDSPELATCFLGALWAGIVPVPINTGYRPKHLQQILADCRPRLLITSPAIRKAVGALSRSDCDVLEIDCLQRLADIVRFAAGDTAPEQASEHTGAFWLYTSGSTGGPKGVVHGHRSAGFCAEAYGVRVLDLRDSDILYSTARIPFAYGLGNSLYFPMWVGASAVLSSPRNVFDILADIRRFRPSVLFSIPTIYAQLMSLPELTAGDLSSLRLCVSAAERLPAGLWRAFRDRFGLEICEGFGTTELLHICISNRPGRCVAGALGLPVPGYSARLVRSDGTQAAEGEPGVLEIGGPSLMLGYWNGDEAIPPAQTQRTGDICTMDEHADVRFLGREDHLFKVRGQWVSPGEIEEVITSCRGIRECAVLGRRSTDDELPEINAYVTLHDDGGWSTALALEVRQHARTRLPAFKVPRQIHVLAALPRTATGKIDRKGLLEQVRGE